MCFFGCIHGESKVFVGQFGDKPALVVSVGWRGLILNGNEGLRVIDLIIRSARQRYTTRKTIGNDFIICVKQRQYP